MTPEREELKRKAEAAIRHSASIGFQPHAHNLQTLSLITDCERLEAALAIAAEETSDKDKAQTVRDWMREAEARAEEKA
jgi:hypothetical protein